MTTSKNENKSILKTKIASNLSKPIKPLGCLSSKVRKPPKIFCYKYEVS